MTLLALSVSAELADATELPRVSDGIASVAFVDAIDSTSSSDQIEEEEDGGERRAASRGRVNMKSITVGLVVRVDWRESDGALNAPWNRGLLQRWVYGRNDDYTNVSNTGRGEKRCLSTLTTSTYSPTRRHRPILRYRYPAVYWCRSAGLPVLLSG